MLNVECFSLQRRQLLLNASQFNFVQTLRLVAHRAGIQWRGLLGRRDDQHEQDDVWLAVIRCWRQRDSRLWGPVLLQMLAPALINETYRLVLGVPRADPVDVQQHLRHATALPGAALCRRCFPGSG